MATQDKREEYRKDFLIAMYTEMFSNINRHILLVWQSVGTFFAAFALLSLTEKNVIDNNIAATLMITASMWLISQCIDSASWYNRNIHIIKNIERNFLKQSDISDILYFFEKPDKKPEMINQIKIQFVIGVVMLLIFTQHHFFTIVMPSFNLPNKVFDLQKAIPYIILAALIIAIILQYRHSKKMETKLTNRSPGIDPSTNIW